MGASSEASSSGGVDGTSTSTTASSSGEALLVCETTPGVDVRATISAPSAEMPGWGVAFREACDVVERSAAAVTLTCERAGEVSLSMDGLPGLDLSGLPDRLALDVTQTLALESCGMRVALSDEGALLFAHVEVPTPDDLADAWYEALAPFEVSSSPRDCAATAPGPDGVTCWPAALEVQAANDAAVFIEGEDGEVAGAHVYVSRMADCSTKTGAYCDPVRFTLVDASLR